MAYSKEEIIQEADRPQHTPNRLEINTSKGLPVPVLQLAPPNDDSGEKGIILCGDSVVDDLIGNNPDLKERYFVVSTTQSQVVPENIGPDLHIFTNTPGEELYLQGPAKDIPHEVIGCGHFVDTDYFTPEASIPKTIDALYVAKWTRTKRIELFVEAARQLPDKKFTILGIPMLSGRKQADSLAYRQEILEQAMDLQNIEFIEPPEAFHTNEDGTVVPGSFSKEQMRDLFRSTRVATLLADTGEGINRAVCEAASCNAVILVTNDTLGGTPYVINDNPGVGVTVESEPQAIATNIQYMIDNPQAFTPRTSFMDSYGIANSNTILRQKIEEVAQDQGVTINVGEYRPYTGDIWSMDYYSLSR